MNTDFPDPQFVQTNGIRLAYYAMGEGMPVVLCHGFPELGYSWHQVMPILAEAGYRAIAVDQRGYGASERPPRTEDYAVTELAADIAGLLDALDIDKAVYVGHDWGAPVVWNSALLQPDKVAGVIGVNNPYNPVISGDPLELLRAEWGDEHYVVNFHNKGPDDPESSDVKFNANVEQVFRGLYRRNLFSMDDFAQLPKEQRVLRMEPIVFNPDPPGELVLGDEELSHFVRAFEETGFTPGLNWYRNISRNWRATKDLDPHIQVPCLMIEVTGDPSGPPGCTEPMRPYIADLESAVIADCGHWTAHEKPQELGAIMIDWLGRRFGALT
jgi:pimeloyl-ACP methyl ester carboxylesterase